MSQLKEYDVLEETFFIVDLLASEYGWTIEYIQGLTFPEITGLIKAIVKRRNGTQDVDNAKVPAVPPKQELDELIKLAKSLKATPQQLTDIQAGKQVRL